MTIDFVSSFYDLMNRFKLRLKPVVRFVNRKAWKSQNHKNRKATEVQCITQWSRCSQ